LLSDLLSGRVVRFGPLVRPRYGQPMASAMALGRSEGAQTGRAPTPTGHAEERAISTPRKSVGPTRSSVEWPTLFRVPTTDVGRDGPRSTVRRDFACWTQDGPTSVGGACVASTYKRSLVSRTGRRMVIRSSGAEIESGRIERRCWLAQVRACHGGAQGFPAHR
jgi:hypothetical protein